MRQEGMGVTVCGLTMMLLLVCSVGVFSGCGSEDSADTTQAQQTRQAMQEAQRQVGMPAITNFQERRLAKMIFELRDREDLPTYAYIVSWEGKLIFIGKCVGFGLPYSTQFTNPERIARYRHDHYGTLPQPDPNGLFTPTGLSATWLMMVDPKSGDVRPVYVEPEIIVSPFPLHQE